MGFSCAFPRSIGLCAELDFSQVDSPIRCRQQCGESWSGINTELRRRYDLIPNLVAAVKGYAAHERDVFQAVTEDRIQAARRFYNANVRDINTRIEVFPSNAIAGMFKFQTEEFFEVEGAGIRAAPSVNVRAH